MQHKASLQIIDAELIFAQTQIFRKKIQNQL